MKRNKHRCQKLLGQFWAAVWLVAATNPSPLSAQEPGPATSVIEDQPGEMMPEGAQDSATTTEADACDAAYRSGRFASALTICQHVLDEASSTGTPADAAAARYRVAIVLNALNRKPEALRELRISRTEAQEAEARVVELYTLNREGVIEHSAGNTTQAIESFSAALAVQGVSPNEPARVHAEANRGTSRYARGDYYRALEDLTAAADKYKKIEHTAGLTSTRINIGLVHQALGDYRFAEQEFERALELAQEAIPDDRRVAEAHHNLGYLAGARKDYTAAKYHYSVALEIYGDDDSRRASTLNNLGVANGELKNYELAERQLMQSIDISRVNNLRITEGRALDSLATVQAYQERRDEALLNYHRALLVKQETEDREGERQTLANIGRQLRAQGELTLATLFYKRSVNVTEEIRSDLTPLPPVQQRSYVETVSDAYRELSDLLTQQGRLLEAQRMLDLLRVQEVHGYLGALRGGDQDATGIPQTPAEQEILEDYDSLAARAIEIGKELAWLKRIPMNERTDEQTQRMVDLEAQQQRLNKEFDDFITSDEVKATVERLRERIGDEAISLSVLRRINDRLAELDYSAVVLYPLVLENRLELILATPESRPIHRAVAVTRDDLRAAVFNLLESLRNPLSDPTGPAGKLYDLVIRPFEPELSQLRTEAILYAPDDALRYVPLAAFHDGNDWLIRKVRVSTWTDSSRENLVSPMSTELKVLGGAYTVPGHSIIVGSRQFSFAGLPFAGDEMETISALIDGTLAFPGASFRLDSLYIERHGFNILHLATHAAVVEGQPSDSFILFGDGQRLSIQDIRSLDFNLDLAVLSACETAVSSDAADGIEVLGLGYAMQQSGVRSTVASLWSVSDGGTHALMSEFYRQLDSGKRKSEALQNAQQLLIDNDEQAIRLANRGLAIAPQVASRLSHPYYWAPFIIIGSGL